ASPNEVLYRLISTYFGGRHRGYKAVPRSRREGAARSGPMLREPFCHHAVALVRSRLYSLWRPVRLWRAARLLRIQAVTAVAVSSPGKDARRFPPLNQESWLPGR